MESAYAWMLWMLRAFLRARRALTRRLPDGVSDIAGALAHFNFLRLFPTLLALALVPDHFFRRLDRLIKGRFLLFSSPAQSIIQLAAALGVVKVLGLLNINQELTIVILLILGITAPIWTYAVIVFVNYFTLFVDKVETKYGGLAGLFFHAVRTVVTPSWLDTALGMMFSTRSLAKLNLSRYAQGMLFFVGYSCLALPLCVVPTALFIVPAELLLNPDSSYDDNLTRAVVQLSFLAAVLGVWVTTSWLFLRPISYLFLHCLNSPGETSLKYETMQLQQLSSKAYFDRKAGFSMMLSDEAAVPDSTVRRIKAGLAVLLARWKMAELKVAKESPEALLTLLAQRRELSTDFLQFRLFIDPRVDVDLSEKLDRIEAGNPLSSVVPPLVARV